MPLTPVGRIRARSCRVQRQPCLSGKRHVRTITGLRAATTFASEEDKRFRVPATVDLLLRQPALAASALARRLAITPQAMLRLFARLEQAGLVREMTGREFSSVHTRSATRCSSCGVIAAGGPCLV
jgi:predicted Rossmann fold nucleotide-binding protein DprA/Smf involved in DNA uptake